MPPHVDLTVLETLDEEPRPIIVNVATLKADQRDRAFFALVKLLFFTERPRFFQFSITGDVYSVVGSPEDLRELAESSCALVLLARPRARGDTSI